MSDEKLAIQKEFFDACRANNLEAAKSIAKLHPTLNYPLHEVVDAYKYDAARIMLLVAKETPGAVFCKTSFRDRIYMLNRTFDLSSLYKDDFLDMFIDDNNLILFDTSDVVRMLALYKMNTFLIRVFNIYHPVIAMTEDVFLRIIWTKDEEIIALVLKLFPCHEAYLRFQILCEMIGIYLSENYFMHGHRLLMLKIIKNNLDSLKEKSGGFYSRNKQRIVIRGLYLSRDKPNDHELDDGDIYSALFILNKPKVLQMFYERYPEENHDSVTEQRPAGERILWFAK